MTIDRRSILVGLLSLLAAFGSWSAMLPPNLTPADFGQLTLTQWGALAFAFASVAGGALGVNIQKGSVK